MKEFIIGKILLHFEFKEHSSFLLIKCLLWLKDLCYLQCGFPDKFLVPVKFLGNSWHVLDICQSTEALLWTPYLFLRMPKNAADTTEIED